LRFICLYLRPSELMLDAIIGPTLFSSDGIPDAPEASRLLPAHSDLLKAQYREAVIIFNDALQTV
jgi:hypothetical protein